MLQIVQGLSGLWRPRLGTWDVEDTVLYTSLLGMAATYISIVFPLAHSLYYRCTSLCVPDLQWCLNRTSFCSQSCPSPNSAVFSLCSIVVVYLSLIRGQVSCRPMKYGSLIYDVCCIGDLPKPVGVGGKLAWL